jgi:hypothetical protein
MLTHPQNWDFWIHHRRSAEKEPTQSGKQLYIRLTGSRAVTNRYTSEAQSPAPGTSRFGIGWDIFGETGEILGLGFGSFFLCLVVFLFLFLFLRVAACVCFLAS